MATEKFEPRLGAESHRMERFRALNPSGRPPLRASGTWVIQSPTTNAPPSVPEQQEKTPETSVR